MANAPLPHDWRQLLDRFSEALDGVQQSLAKAEALEAASASKLRAAALQEQLQAQAAPLTELNDRAAAVDRWMGALDAELRASEEVLRVLLTQTETVRQKLATWAGRAIG